MPQPSSPSGLQDPRLASLAQLTKRVCQPWQTDEYDDVELLRELRKENPGAKWSEICEMLNSRVPADRGRTPDGVSSKWKTLTPKGSGVSREAREARPDGNKQALTASSINV